MSEGVAQNKNRIHSEWLAKENMQDNRKDSMGDPGNILRQQCAVGYP